MRQMVLRTQGQPLQLSETAIPSPGPNQILVKVLACGVCRTDLHVVEGDLAEPKLPVVPGHEVVGRIEQLGARVETFREGDRVGIPWLAETCQQCRYCQDNQENLCEKAKFTGYTADGGYADYVLADQRFCFYIPDNYSDIHAAPLLCAGLIGYRSLAMAGDSQKIGLYGFGAAAHIIAQIADHQGRQLFAFTRPGDSEAQQFALDLGARWSASSDTTCPEELDAAIIFAPVGSLVPTALSAIRKGGIVICAGIYMSNIPTFSYDLLWGERTIRSVANLTRRDGEAFLKIAGQMQIRTKVHPYALEQANSALTDLRNGKFQGAAVIVPDLEIKQY